MKNHISASVESTEDVELPDAQWCLIYEKTTGKVIHLHQFLPLTPNDLIPREELERGAMSVLESERRGQTDGLGVFHPQLGEMLKPGMIYSVELGTLTLLGKPIDVHRRISKAGRSDKKG